MRTTSLVASVVLLLATWTVAQQSTQSSAGQTATQGATGSGQQTIRGCLSGSGSTYTLTDDSGRTWQLQAPATTLNMMKEHVGHEVAITGTPASASSSESSSTAGSTSSTTNTNALRVQNLQHIADTCATSSGAGPGAAAMGTGGATGAAAESSGRTIGSAMGETAQANTAATASPAGTPPPVTSQTPARPERPTNTEMGSNPATQAGSGGMPANSTPQASGAATSPPPRVITDESQPVSQPGGEQPGDRPSQSANLPQTASPLPLFGLTGFGLLATGIAGRRRR